MTARIVVLASGSGSLLQALIDSKHRGQGFEIVALITDSPNSLAIQRAASAGIPVAILPVSDFTSRGSWDAGLTQALCLYEPDWVVSAGFMRILGEYVLQSFGGRIINTHPALLPAFPGAHAVRDALQAKAKRTGSTVHFVDAGVDTGPIIVQEAVDILADDTIDSLHERIKEVERRLLEEVVVELSDGKIELIDGEVSRNV